MAKVFSSHYNQNKVHVSYLRLRNTSLFNVLIYMEFNIIAQKYFT